MATQTATTGNLANAQRIAIAQCRYTLEHNAPCVNLVEQFDLAQGEKQITVPKVAQMTAQGLTDGVDLADTEDIGMTTTDLTTAEVGLKVILTDKLVRQENESVFNMVGVQMGDAMARKKDRDIIALFSALNAGTLLGGTTYYLKAANAAACIAWAKSAKAPPPIYIVHHPNTIAYLAYQAATTMATYGMPQGPSADLLKNFYRFTMNQVEFYEDGNIDVVTGYTYGIGAVFSKSAMCHVSSQELRTEPERDASLRATELVVTSDYGVFELDDGYGAGMEYYIAALSTAA